MLPAHFEGMPLVVVEAMLCGRTCLVTDVAGHMEWISDGEDGFIATTNHTKLLKQKLKDAFKLKEQWQSMGEKAHLKALDNFEKNAGKNLLNHLVEH